MAATRVGEDETCSEAVLDVEGVFFGKEAYGED